MPKVRDGLALGVGDTASEAVQGSGGEEGMGGRLSSVRSH